MKWTIPFFCSVLLLGSVHAQTVEDPFAGMDGPKLKFEKEHSDMGDLAQGEKATETFPFTNAGNQPLVIHNVITTCGCTVPEWPEKPLLPGESGQLKVVFDSTGRIGRQNKIITVQSNALGQYHRVKISAMVLPPAENH